MKIAFAGTPDFAAVYLESLLQSHHRIQAVLTQPDKPGKRGRSPIAGPVKNLAQSKGIILHQPTRLSRADLEDLDVDTMVVVAFGQILPPDILAWPRLGCINVHASLLPRWRGAAPIQRAILAGDHETGICVMQMDDGLDTGDVLSRSPVAIEDRDTAGSLSKKLEETGTAALLRVLDQLEAGTATPKPQSTTGTTYARKLSKDEARINWRASAREVDLAIRAFNPDPVSYTFLDQLRIRVLAAEPTATTQNAEPGTVVDLDSTGVRVACTDGNLMLTHLQLPLGKGSVLTGRDILNSRRALFAPGTRFD